MRQNSERTMLQDFCVFLGLVGGYAIVLLRDEILPERFLYDGVLIRRIALGETSADFSYANTASVYSFLGLQNHPMIAYIAGYTLAAIAILIAAKKSRSVRGGWGMIILTILAFFLSAIYLGYYSKDVLILPITIAALAIRPSRISGPILVVLMLVYASQFRTYWYFVAILFVAFWLILPRVRSFWLVIIGALATTASGLAIYLALGLPPNAFRENVNEWREDVGTLITPFVSLPEPVGGLANNAITYLTLIFPVPIVLKGTLYYFMIAVIFAALWLFYFRAVSLSEIRTRPVTRRSAALIISFLCTQALFEPDYGSALRHLTPLLPLFLYVVWQSMGIRNELKDKTQAVDAKHPSSIPALAPASPALSEKLG